jgi:DNA replication protein DnaC
VIDDWGLTPFDDLGRRDMLEILEDRHGRRSTLVASQLPIAAWHDMIGDKTLADAILDRLVHNAYKIPLIGESMRKTAKSLTQSGH